MATFYSDDGEECFESPGSYTLGWGDPKIEEAQVPDGSTEIGGLMKKLYDLFEYIGQHQDLRAALSRRDPEFYSNRSQHNYRYLEWYDIAGERNSESEFFYPDNMEIDENGIVSFSAHAGYLVFDKEESEEVLELIEECKEYGQEEMKEREAKGEEWDDDIYEDIWKHEMLFYALKELSTGAGSTWYKKESIDKDKLIKDAIKLNEDLRELERADLCIVDTLLNEK